MRLYRRMLFGTSLIVGCLVIAGVGDPALSVDTGSVHHRAGWLTAVDAQSSSDVWMVGYRKDDGRSLVEHWDGTAIVHVAIPDRPDSSSDLSGVSASSASDAWVVGASVTEPSLYQTLTEHWDGAAWQIVPSPSPGGSAPPSYNFLTDVAAISTTNAWATGVYEDPEGNERGLIEHWDGKRWRRAHCACPGQEQTLYAVSGVSANDIWAVGSWSDAKDRSHALLEHWDGTRWSYTPSPRPKKMYGLSDISEVSANDVWAVGYRADDGDHQKSLIEHWDGTTWTIVSSPNDPLYSHGLLSSVSADSSDDAWAMGGNFWLHWDGKTWRRVEPINPFQDIEAVATITPDDAWAVGDHNGTGVQVSNHWNGTRWSRV